MTNDQILLTSAALEAKMEAIVDLSETFHQKQDMIGSVACILNMVRPLGLEEDFPETERHTGEPGTDQTHRDTIIQEAITKLEAIRQRTEAHRHTGNEFGQPTPQNISDAQIAGMAIEQFSNAQAIRALTDFINNQDAHPQTRWGAYGLATGIAIEAGVPVRLEAIGNRTDWHAAGAKETIIDLMNSTQNQQGNWRDNLHQAAKQICAQYGIDQPSDDMLERPGVVSDVIQLRDPEQRYELTTDLMPEAEEYIDGVVFKYRDLTYIKTIREPFPEGFPAPTAAEIAEQYLSRCTHPRRNPGDTDWDYYTQAGLTALRRAQLQLHSISPDSMAKFVNKIQELLPPDSEMVRHIMTIVTSRDDDLQNALLQGHYHTSAITDPNNANRIIKAARRAGFSTELWELAKLLGIEPDNYGITKPTLEQKTMDQIAKAAKESGIPGHIVTTIRAETTQR